MPRRVTPGNEQGRRDHDSTIVGFGATMDMDVYQMRPVTFTGHHTFRIVTDLSAPLSRTQKQFLLEHKTYQW